MARKPKLTPEEEERQKILQQARERFRRDLEDKIIERELARQAAERQAQKA